MKKPFLLCALSAFILAGCTGKSVQDLKSSPGYHKSVTTGMGYQEALKTVKDGFAEMQGHSLNCTVYSDMGRGECTADSNTGGVFIFISAQRLTDKSSTVDFYTAAVGAWPGKIETVAARLARQP